MNHFSRWNDFLLHLTCVSCKNKKYLSYESENRVWSTFAVSSVLKCLNCGRTYPCYDGIPILFPDVGRIKVQLDNGEREKRAHVASEEDIAIAAGRKKRDEIKTGTQNSLEKSLDWEMHFWEKFKGTDQNETSKAYFQKCLANDFQGGGKLLFMKRILKIEDGQYENKLLLNVGAFKDPLLENLTESGLRVIEQDVILPPLISLKKRGAAFAVCCDARSLPFSNSFFNLLTCHEVLHHIWPIEEPIKEFARVTNGNIYFHEPNALALTTIMGIILGPIKKYFHKFLYTTSHSPSPFEKSINPKKFIIAAKQANLNIYKLNFSKTSWIRADGSIVRKMMRTMLNCISLAFPIFSSHFFVALKKN